MEGPADQGAQQRAPGHDRHCGLRAAGAGAEAGDL